MAPSPETAPSPDSSSSTPSPPSNNSSSAESAASPPPKSSPPSPPLKSSPSPPPPSPPPSSSPPPPPSSDDDSSSSSSSSTSPPPPKKSNTPPKSSSSTPDSPSDNSGSDKSPSDNSPSDVVWSPPPPQKEPGRALPSHTPPSRSNYDSDQTTPSSGNGSNLKPQVVAGIVVAALGAFLILMLVVACVCCFKKKKKKPTMHYYADAGPKGSGYYNNAPPPKWHNGAQGMDHGSNLPPPPGSLTPPGGGWHAPPPPTMMTNSDASSAFSGPHGPPLPPPSPTLALGFNKSTFSYDELAAATGGFSPANMLGQGGFGYVYKGLLPNGKEVAVKQLKSGSGQGEREFQAEVEIISRVHHRHLVSLVGYCITGAHRMLVYEFVTNKTLEHHLHGKGVPVMDFPTRLKIALGSAKGLAYLHEDCHPRIIHRDIKTANILLDFKFEAMVADFGLAKLSQDNYTHVSTRIMGTFGYLAPEYASSGKLTEKSDVFSYGVMLLELITGRRPVDSTQMEDSLVDWARPLLSQALAEGSYDEIVDPRLENNYNPVEMARLVASAAACVRHSARRRPKMSQIVRALEGDVSLEDLNEGVKPGQSSMFSSSSDYDSSSYSSNMRQFRKVALASADFSEEYMSRPTSEYGLNPSESSSSGEQTGVGGQRQKPPRPL